MTIRTFIIGSLIAALVSGGSWLLVVLQLPPSRAGALGFALFFLSFFVAIASMFGLVGYFCRRILLRRQFMAYVVRTSLRQGIMVALFASFLLFLQLIKLYRWWVALALVVILGCSELFFLHYDRASQRQVND